MRRAYKKPAFLRRLFIFLQDMKYVFTSERLGFRNWTDADIDKMTAINQDPETMRYFPNLPSREDTINMIRSFQKEYEEQGYTYFAVETLDEGAFIGFTGLHVPTYEADFMPCVDMGWRLDKRYWNKGYATEAAKRCMQFGFDVVELDKLVATAPKVNLPSIHVMEKIGMKRELEFKHPRLKGIPYLEDCVLYTIKKDLLK